MASPCTGAMNLRVFEKNSLLVAMALFIAFGLLLLLSTGGEISSITSDIDMYNHYVVSRFPDLVSESAKSIENSSARIEYFDQTGWTPSPFYSIIFLSPIWLFSSDLLLWAVGMAIGMTTIFVAHFLLERHFDFLSKSTKGLIIILFSLNFNFVIDSVGVSTMSVAALFVMGAFAVRNRFLRALFFVGAAMTRSNFLIALVALFMVGAFISFKGKRYLIMECLPAVAVSILFYKLYYSTYPGGGLNYLLFASYQGLDYAVPFSRQLISSVYGVEDSDALNFNMSPRDALKLLFRWDSLSYIFNLSVLKLSVSLGFIHEKLFKTDYGFYLAKIWRTLYFVCLALPGTYSAIALSWLSRLSALERMLYGWALTYLLLNSLLIGDPRYLMGVYLILLVALFRLCAVLYSIQGSKA